MTFIFLSTGKVKFYYSKHVKSTRLKRRFKCTRPLESFYYFNNAKRKVEIDFEKGEPQR